MSGAHELPGRGRQRLPGRAHAERHAPGFSLPDRWHVSCNPDTVTAVSVKGGLGSIFAKNVGVLDSRAKARERIPRWLAKHGFDALQKRREAEAARKREE